MITVNKVWGREEWLYNGDYCMKVLILSPSFQSSLHSHPIKHETFLVAKGECDMEINGTVHRLVRGDYQIIPPNTLHRFWAVNGECEIVEASTHHSDDDVVRVEDSRRICE